MRWLLAALVAAAVLALPASAAGVDARLLVLQQVDVPARYVFDEDNSLLIRGGLLAGVADESARALVRYGFVSGYLARYTNYDPPRWRYVNSVAFVFRRPQGARSYMPLLVKSWFAQGSGRSRRIDLGDEAVLYSSGSRTTGTAVVWRYGRVVAYVSCSQMTNHEALTLAQARKQQRRIAAELR